MPAPAQRGKAVLAALHMKKAYKAVRAATTGNIVDKAVTHKIHNQKK